MFNDGIFLKGLFALISLLLGLIGFGSTHILFKIEDQITKTQSHVSEITTLVYNSNAKLESIGLGLSRTDTLVTKIDDIQREEGKRLASIESNIVEIKQQIKKGR